MMKVAIFGDSFADDTLEKYSYPGWPAILKERYNVDIDNYSVCGSCLFFSYNKFLEVHKGYDKIVFVVTAYNRFTIPEYIEFKNVNPLTRHINGPRVIQQWLTNRNLSSQDRLALRAADMYYQYLYDNNKERILHNLIKKDIKNCRPDVIMLDAFTDDPSVVPLLKISEMEVVSQGYPLEMNNKDDWRTCHLSKENNEILADKVFSFLSGNQVKIKLEDFVTPKEDVGQYLK